MARHLVRADLISPALLPFELVSICSKKLRLYPAEREHILSQWALSEQMGIRYEPLRLHNVLSLAEATGLTTYDASYLWLAKARDADLVTVDRGLQRTATASQSSTHPPGLALTAPRFQPHDLHVGQP